LITVAEQPAVVEVTVEVVDSDVHPTPRGAALADYAPAQYRAQLTPQGREAPALHNYYDVPDYSHASAMRLDSFPPGGGFPGSDPQFALHQLLREANVDIAILEPLGGEDPNPELEHVRKCATNDWLADVWLSADHGRWRGAVSVSNKSPALAAREIERWAEHPMFVQVLMSPQVRVNFGDPWLDPIYEAATRHGLPVSTHLMSLGPYEATPLMPVGNEGHWLDFLSPWPLLFTTHLMSLVFDGAFERHPELRVVFVEGAFTWALPAMWRMDKIWAARRGDLPLVKRRPSEYVREHVRFTTQPLEEPEIAADYRRYLEWMDASELVLFSSDYPHWSYNDPGWAAKQFPKATRDRVMWGNATELYGLPRTVPPLPDA
jgi:predicted TIM-barrel fold metal-dependent hydrolase